MFWHDFFGLDVLDDGLADGVFLRVDLHRLCVVRRQRIHCFVHLRHFWNHHCLQNIDFGVSSNNSDCIEDQIIPRYRPIRRWKNSFLQTHYSLTKNPRVCQEWKLLWTWIISSSWISESPLQSASRSFETANLEDMLFSTSSCILPDLCLSRAKSSASMAASRRGTLQMTKNSENDIHSALAKLQLFLNFLNWTSYSIKFHSFQRRKE